MKSQLGSLLIAGWLLGGCSGNSTTEDLAGGGFETSDLKAIVVDSSGKPVVGARVWVVTESADSLAAATAFDSAFTGAAGLASLQPVKPKTFGLEAWSGDTLAGFAFDIDRDARDTVRLVLSRTRVVFLPCSTFTRGAFHAQGSHFRQMPPSVCVDSFAILVPGVGKGRMTWFPGDSTGIDIPFDLESLPIWRGPPPVTGPHGNPNGQSAGPPGQAGVVPPTP